MILLICGIILFFGIHLLPSTPLKLRLLASVGEKKYKLCFSAVSLAGLGLIIYGFSTSDFVALYNPLPWGRAAAIYVMPIAIVLLVAADMPTVPTNDPEFQMTAPLMQTLPPRIQ